MYCSVLIISIAMRTISCPDLGLSYRIAIPKTESNRYYGEHKIREILYKPKAFYNKPLPRSVIGDYVICLDIPNKDSCLHGWSNPNVLGKAVSSECYRLLFDDIQTLWMHTFMDTKVLIQ